MAEPDPQQALTRDVPTALSQTLPQMTRAYLWVCAASCALAAVLVLVLAGQAPNGGHTLPAALFAALALASAAATRQPEGRMATVLTAVLVGITLTVGANGWLMGWGLRSPGLGVTGMLVCLLCIVAGWRTGATLAAVSAAVVVATALLAPGPVASAGGPPAGLLVGAHLLAIAAGLASGTLVSQTVLRFMHSAQERGARFRSLLALAADAHWEIDTQYRVVAATGQHKELFAMTPDNGLGRVLWEVPQFGCEPHTLARLQADLQARRPLRDLPIRWSTANGHSFAFLLSGEPRRNAHGQFTGYWGVARDVTAVQAANEALVATETRYRDLFSHIPTPLVLHRQGRVIDANPAALVLFGHADLAAMLGTDVMASLESGDSRERVRRRLEQLQDQPTGTALPLAGYRLVVQGRRVPVRATGVRVQAGGGPALLAIFIDDTERTAAEDAVRRSEAMLSHLVASSPDIITLTDLETGQYTMVNHSFERLLGWSAAEAVGKTSIELGVWGSEEQRNRFVQQLQTEGAVSNLRAQFGTKQGPPVDLAVSGARFAMERRNYLVINARDVSEPERQRLERIAILDGASIGIAVTRQQHFVLANPHFEQIYGWGPGELPGQSGAVVWASAEDHAAVGRLVGPGLARGEAVELERPARRKDGSSFVARIRGRAVDPTRPTESGTVWIVEDVTERRQFEQALARARDDAEAASRAKSAFLANTSHELRTPLNGIIGLARLARDSHTDEARRHQYLGQIVDSAQSLAGIISDILDLSKIEAGKLDVESTTFDLGVLLYTLQRTYTTLAAAHGLGLALQAAPDVDGLVRGDPLRLRQILSNYLSNALKFTPAGQVLLRAQRLDSSGHVRFEVQDTGLGIEAGVCAQLFQPFMQADQSTTRRYGGTGLGLSICRELATLMGGSVGVDSQPGVGSVFWAELPLPAVTTEAGLLLAAADRAPPDLQGRSVLMVEDNAVNMMIAVAFLERWGVTVTQAHDGHEALAAVQRAADAGQPFDAVLMDVQMPLMSGHEATRALRAAGHQVPVIALTAAALVTERNAALESGMNDFLTKPIDADKLQATLARWCNTPRGSGTMPG